MPFAALSHLLKMYGISVGAAFRMLHRLHCVLVSTRKFQLGKCEMLKAFDNQVEAGFINGLQKQS